MEIEILQEPITALAEYARIPVAFEVRRMLELQLFDQELGFMLSERWLEVPYVKDYDALPDNAPEHWAERFDLSSWALFGAHAEGRRVGGVAIAFGTEGLASLEGRDDLAMLWDIRVSLETRGQGVGAALFDAAEAWATTKGCSQLKAETQNINVPACRFYARQGCVLGGIHRFAYPELPHEIQLLWYKQLQ
jgi:GNAT superfamily N-acetyltransferase